MSDMHQTGKAFGQAAERDSYLEPSLRFVRLTAPEEQPGAEIGALFAVPTYGRFGGRNDHLIDLTRPLDELRLGTYHFLTHDELIKFHKGMSLDGKSDLPERDQEKILLQRAEYQKGLDAFSALDAHAKPGLGL